MKLRNLFQLVIAVLFVFTSCRKDVTDPQAPVVAKSIDLSVTDNFSWSTTRAVDLKIHMESENASGLLSRIRVFTSDPSNGGKWVAQGSAGYGFPFTAQIILPAYTEGIWIEAQKADGSQEIVYQTVQSGSLEYTFNSTKQVELKSVASGPDCSTGCDQTISGSGTVTIKNGLTYCVTNSFTGTINFEHWNGGGTLRVCGNASPQSINNMGNNCHIVVADGGTFSIQSLVMDGTSSFTAWNTSTATIGSLNMNMTSTTFTNYSSNFLIESTFSPNGTVTNYGSLVIQGDYNGNSPNGQLINSGTITLLSSLSMNNNLTNSGTINIGNHLNLNTNHSFNNSCKIIVQNNANLNSGTFTMNGGYLQVGGTYQINGSSQFIMQNQSMVSAVNVILNKGISGAGSKNTIKTSGNATINASQTVSGAIEWADNDAVLTNGSVNQFVGGATFVLTSNATNYIPVSACNPTGIGNPVVSDTDGDGVADVIDDYPADPTRAYNNYYPSSTSWSSLAFEDLWPNYGDYDLNDLVVNVRFNRITNAQNKVVDLINLYDVKAVGGTLHNGFAFQLDQVNVGSIQSVTGYQLSGDSYINLASNGLEEGTTKPVIVVWDDADNVINRVGGTFFNTEDNGLIGTSDIVTITVHFNTPQTANSVGLPPYNHFLIKGKNRGTEIHLSGSVPTSKVNTALFGTGDDDTNPGTGKFYKSATNLPWAIFIAEEFDHPLERVDIVNAHLKFAAWAQSNGSQYTDWYMNKAGYRNANNIW